MTEPKVTRGHSCVPCQHRKIRCNGQTPCAYCVKTGKDCVRIRLSPTHTRNARLNQRRLVPEQSQSESLGRDGQVIVSGDQRRYVEDNKLWKSLGNEMEGRDLSPDPERPARRARTGTPSTERNLIFGHQKSDSASLEYPSAVHSFQLWQVFLSNVHPLTKILHGPTVQKDILETFSTPSSTTGPMGALIFAIYLVAVVSLTDKECRSMFSTPREVLLARYCDATEVALSKADFLRSTDLRVLQGFTLHLLSLRHICDHDILWLLTGLATRMGQRMGLHRESSLKDLPPFEAELRRRLWWQIVILDGRASQLTGASMNPDMQLYGDTRQPVNLSDADLVPSASILPLSSPSTTDMVFCKVRIEIGVWMITQRCLLDSSCGTSAAGQAKFFKAINELERHIEDEYLSKMDKEFPLNILTAYLARSAICQLRLSVYHPNHRRERTSDLSAEQINILLENSMEVIHYDILSHSSPVLQKYLWHISNFFPFETFILLISTLSARTAGRIVDSAWHVINQVYEHHPFFISDTGDPLYWALGNITLKAWDQRVANARAEESPVPQELPCITNLVQTRSALASETSQQASTTQDAVGPATPQSLPQINEVSVGDPSELGGMARPVSQTYPGMAAGEDFLGTMTGVDMDWDFWQQLLDGNANDIRGGNNQESFHFSSFINKT
ncbi:fungal specific transcription factor domain-containing protein [Fusarium avenaceum]|nr:fungal-specific transcription factor domain-containing protein [Fusarium avenaceum]KIL87783.1 fungal specific transcription factor domain-containing protein [Fusarium avenaceum]